MIVGEQIAIVCINVKHLKKLLIIYIVKIQEWILKRPRCNKVKILLVREQVVSRGSFSDGKMCYMSLEPEWSQCSENL